jgi:hypothetical protein
MSLEHAGHDGIDFAGLVSDAHQKQASQIAKNNPAVPPTFSSMFCIFISLL